MKKPTPKPIRERAWVRLLDEGYYVRDTLADGALMLWASEQGASWTHATAVEVEIRSVPRKARKRARKA